MLSSTLGVVESYVMTMTLSATSGSSVDVSILYREFMPKIAVSLSGVYGKWTVAAGLIHKWRHKFKVPRICAISSAAQMVWFQTFRNVSAKEFVCNAMRLVVPPQKRFAVLLGSNLSIPLFVQSTYPQPASCIPVDDYFAQEALSQASSVFALRPAFHRHVRSVI